ncbi:invasion associated locus B family protein [Falsihalocynthiibacter sp. SS001]|uniref:invasion associated locus B family protein n=1 Tax=Falsihalocynthiibacter sp. SS001 TaxID=3349698 RepID=UPI0036D28605
MNIATKSIFAACVIALPTFAIAQDASTAENAEATEATETAPSAPVEELSTGQPVHPGLPGKDDAEVGEEYLLETSGDWELRCAKTDTEKDPCQMYQLLRNEEGPFAEISLFPINEDGNKAVAGATIITPLDTMLAPGILIAVDGTNARRYPFAWCSSVGCIGRLGFLQEDIAAYKKGSVADLQIIPAVAPDQTVTAQVSLTGFTAAYDKLVEMLNAE